MWIYGEIMIKKFVDKYCCDVISSSIIFVIFVGIACFLNFCVGINIFSSMGMSVGIIVFIMALTGTGGSRYDR